MPPVQNEEAALLGKEKMDDIELRSVQLQLTSVRPFGETKSEVRVRTDTCDLLVVAQGDHTKPCIITYHDIGLNWSHFEPFFNHREMKGLMKNFFVLHVNAPGQEDGAPNLPDDCVYSMDDLSNQINYVLCHFAIKSFIGFGVGAGANVLARFALANPQKVDALALVNCSSTQAGWIEWACQKMNSRILRSRGMTQGVVDYLMWHHFGRTPERISEISDEYRAHFCSGLNAHNLGYLVESYARRTDLGIEREGTTLRMPVLNVTAAHSPHINDTVTLNGRLNPTKSTWLKVSDCALVLEEEPRKVAEAFRLFLQGEGYVPPVTPTEGAWWDRGGAGAGKRRVCRTSPVIRITENPISEAVAC
ncbi:hypothetical protein ACJJTC_000667 [Scirpophaga incertulas]